MVAARPSVRRDPEFAAPMVAARPSVRRVCERPPFPWGQPAPAHSESDFGRIDHLLPGDPRFPEVLGKMTLQAAELWTIGDTDLLAHAPERLVAIVGTREATQYGLRVARALGRAFGEAGAVVVSGLARGIDSAAHEGALEVGGKTVAVLGTGIDVPYPAGNRRLHAHIADKGLVVSENRPGRKAYLGCFPRRNRIIAALSKATIVVEAGHKSGALNTATQATELGRIVGGIPGPIDLPVAAGVNLLIRDGAHMVASIGDALGLMGLSRNATAHKPEMGADEAEVWAVLGEGQAPVDGLCARSGLPVRRVLEAVSRLEIAGLVGRLASGEIARVVLEEAAR